MKRIPTTGIACSLAMILAGGQANLAQAISLSSSSLAVNETSRQHHSHKLARRWNYRFNVRASRYRRGGISRGEECPTEIISSVTPPVDEMVDGELAATTYLGTAAHPVFYISTPQLPKTKLKLTIQLENESLADFESTLYEVEYEIEGQPGIVGLKTPTTLPPLELDTRYRWEVSVFCAPDSEDPLAVDDSMVLTGGVIQRVNDIASSPSTLDSYLEAGIWQDALAIVAETYYRNPNNPSAAQDWADLMDTAELTQLKTKPIVDIQDGIVLWQAAL
ncbi:MAG: DUF928 domain-containing protein [Cyanobacteria bacterium J06642_11]